MMSRRSFLLAVPAIVSLPCSAAFADVYPSKPIRIIVPISPGSGTDVTARHMAVGLAKVMNSQVYVENKPGAGGIIGTQAVAKSPSDGYTILFTYASHYINQWVVENTPYNAVNDFEPIARISSSALILVTSADSPWRTVADIVAAAKRDPNGLSYASAGNGTPSHVCGALLAATAGITLNHIPNKSASQALVDTISGQVNMAFSGVATTLPLIQSGRLRAVAVTSARRSIHFPDLPTISEAGLKGYDVVSPIWALAPRGTPQPIISKLSDALTTLAAKPDFKEFCLQQGLEVDIQNAATYKSGAAAELEKWKQLIALTSKK